MHHSITTRLPATRHPPPTACRPQHTCAILPTGDLAGRSSWSPRDDFQLSRVPHMVPTASGPMLAGRSTLIGWTRKIILSLAVTQAYGLPAAALPQMPDLMEVGRPNGHIRPLPLLRAALPPPARSRRGGRTKRAPAGRERTASRRRPADAEHHGLLPRTVAKDPLEGDSLDDLLDAVQMPEIVGALRREATAVPVDTEQQAAPSTRRGKMIATPTVDRLHQRLQPQLVPSATPRPPPTLKTHPSLTLAVPPDFERYGPSTCRASRRGRCIAHRRRSGSATRTCPRC